MLVDKQTSSPSSSQTQNILIIQAAVSFSSSSFVYYEIPTNLNDNQLIFNFLKEKGIIMSNNLISTSFDPNGIPINQSQLDIPQKTRLIELVTLTLKRGIYYNPVAFSVSSSLIFQPENDEIIILLSQEVKVQMTIEQNQAGKFVEKQYSGVIISLSENGKSILIYGILAAVNNDLKQKILYFLNPLTPDEVLENLKVNLVISDGLYENLVISQKFIDATKYYLRQKSYIQKNSSLKSRVNEQFNYSDNFPITYQVLLMSNKLDEGFVVFPINYWLKFLPTSLQFSGIAPIFLLNTQVTIKMIATDKYSVASDVFTIKLSILPFTYVLGLLVQILTPLVSIKQIKKYRYLIINLISHKYTSSSKECIHPNQLFVKFILLLDKNVLHANQIAKLYIKEINKKQRNQLRLSNLNLKQSEVVGDITSKYIARYQNPQNIYCNSESRIQFQQNSKIQESINGLQNKLRDIYQSYCTQDFQEVFRSRNLLKNEIFIYEGKKVFLSRYILEKDKKLHNFYLFLKKLSLKSQLFSSNDWYKDYVGICLNEGGDSKKYIENLTLNQKSQKYTNQIYQSKF
ncbi:hypothetical protein ABPG72_014949 [Tetrahymena utriculariae]